MKSFVFLLILLLFAACQSPKPAETDSRPYSAGKLFIIGGGKRPPSLVKALIEVSGIADSGYAIILPMASSEPDTSAYYAVHQFTELGVPADRFISYDFGRRHVPAGHAIDSLRQAQLIYITGGDQVRFMDQVLDTEVYGAIHQAYQHGATIAGTSAGAAVMSEKMITGNEFKHPEYTGEFRTIEAGNMEIRRGLGLLPQAIVDQHFVYRMRMNRLMTVALEHPAQIAMGIDESTALVVQQDIGRVAGIGQIISLSNPGKSVREQAGLLGGKGLQLSVLLPGDTLALDR